MDIKDRSSEDIKKEIDVKYAELSRLRREMKRRVKYDGVNK